MKFGVENSKRSGGLEIRDQETGKLLGGKRAAIQYFYTQRYGDTDGEDGGKNGDGQVEGLAIQTSSATQQTEWICIEYGQPIVTAYSRIMILILLHGIMNLF